MKIEFKHEDVEKEIAESERALKDLDVRVSHLWERIKIKPERWSQGQYPGEGQFWVVGIIGRRCLYYNPVEEGWGWGQYGTWGKISEYHYQVDDIHHVVHNTLFGIDHGGKG